MNKIINLPTGLDAPCACVGDDRFERRGAIIVCTVCNLAVVQGGKCEEQAELLSNFLVMTTYRRLGIPVTLEDFN